MSKPGQQTPRMPPLLGLVLAGGHSRRMGQDKAAMRVHAEPQLERASKLLQAVCETSYVSTRAGQALAGKTGGLHCIEDRIEDAGPLAGILSAQMCHPEAAWLVLACDLPFVEKSTLQLLVAHRGQNQFCIAYQSDHDGLPEPLCAIYEPQSHSLLQESLANGVRCPRRILHRAGLPMLNLEHPEALDNLNFPEDLAEARARLKQKEAKLA